MKRDLRMVWVLGSLLAIATGARPAFAVSFTAFDPSDSFNVITTGDLTNSSEMEGAVLTRGRAPDVRRAGETNAASSATAGTLTAGDAVPISASGARSALSGPSTTLARQPATSTARDQSGTLTNGTAASASFDGSGELQNHPATGDEPPPPVSRNGPEPAAATVLVAALLGLLTARWRTRARARGQARASTRRSVVSARRRTLRSSGQC